MNMPSFFRPIFFIPLVIVFSLVFGASVIYYNKADILVSLVKHFASSSLDLHVETTGKASVTFDGSLMSIDIDDITAQVSSDEALPIARVSGLYVRINLQNVFNGSIEIDQIETKGATLYSNISSKKWLKSQMVAGDDLVSAPIDVLFGEIALNNIKIEFVDPLLGNVENIEFTTLSVSDQGSDNKHKIDINVVIKEDILNLSGLFQNFDEFMLKTKPLIFELTGASHGLAISTSGQLSDLNSDEISHANWNIHAEDLPTWLSLIDPRISLVKGIDTSGEITANDKQVTLNNTVLNLSGDAGKISFSPKGQFVFAPNLKNSSWDFKGDLAFDLTKSKLLLGELVDECPECRRIKGQSTFLFSNKLLALTDLSLDLGLGEDKLEFKAQQFEADLSNLSEDKAKITTTQADIKYHTKDNKEVLVYGYSADDATVDVLSREEIRWHSNGKYLDIPIQLKGHSTGSGLLWSHKISGQLDDAPLELVAAQKEKTIELDIQLDVPDVKLLSRFLLQPLVDMTSAALNAKVVFGDNVVVEDLKLSVLGPNHNVILDGSVGNLLTFDDYKLTLDIKAKHAKTLEKWLAANTMPLAKTIESFTYSSTFAANRKASDHKKLNDPWFPNLIAQIDVANWFTLFPLTSASLGTTLDIISKGDRIDIHNLSVKLKQDNTTLSWAGDLSNLKQNESIKGDFNADFAQDFWVWQKAPLTVQSSMTGNFELIKFPDIKIAAGKTLINGDAYLTTSNTAPKLGGQFTTPNLDTLAWTKAPKELFEADKPDKSMSFSVPEIPEWLIAFDKWSDYAFDISLKADKVASHWFNFNDFNGHFLRQKNQLTIDGGGDLTKGRMSLIYEVEKKGSQYFESLLLTGYDINQQDMPLEDPLINIKSGSIDGIVNITGRGKTSNEILASSNGRFTLSSKSVELTGDWLDDIAPDVIESVLNRINPFPKKEGEEKNTQIECGIIHFSITNGQWVAKDSIQLITPVLSLLGRGEMDFKEENLRFMFVPQTREGLGFSVMGTLTEMAAVEGPMDNPQIKIAPYEVLKKGGLNLVGMVLLGPFFAIPYNQYNKITSGPEDCFKKIKENPVPKI